MLSSSDRVEGAFGHSCRKYRRRDMSIKRFIAVEIRSRGGDPSPRCCPPQNPVFNPRNPAPHINRHLGSLDEASLFINFPCERA